MNERKRKKKYKKSEAPRGHANSEYNIGETPIRNFAEQNPQGEEIKKPSTPSQNTKQQDDSITNVHFLEKGAYKYVSGVREPIAIRVDTGLYKCYKPLAKRIYGSVCRGIELHITSVIEAVENGVHFSNTEKPINIEKIVIERNLRSRRRFEISEETEVTETVSVVKCAFCDYKAVVQGTRKDGTMLFLCDRHKREERARKRLRSWRNLNVE